MSKIYIPISDEEFVALARLANRNLRHPRDQARLILRSVLMNESSAEMSKPAIAESLATRSNNGFVTGNPA